MSTDSSLPPSLRVSTQSTLAPTLPLDPTADLALTQPSAFTYIPTLRSIVPITGVSTQATTQTTVPPAHDITASHSIGDSA